MRLQVAGLVLLVCAGCGQSAVPQPTPQEQYETALSVYEMEWTSWERLQEQERAMMGKVALDSPRWQEHDAAKKATEARLMRAKRWIKEAEQRVSQVRNLRTRNE